MTAAHSVTDLVDDEDPTLLVGVTRRGAVRLYYRDSAVDPSTVAAALRRLANRIDPITMRVPPPSPKNGEAVLGCCRCGRAVPADQLEWEPRIYSSVLPKIICVRCLRATTLDQRPRRAG
jgi:hypothetical protein